jgi:P4 family phage/plasmid primase-like protien
MSMIEEAAALRQRGIGIVWLRPGEKLLKRPGWSLASQEPGDYTPGSNLGVLTGRLSGDLVCVDLDSAMANELADQFLPPTPMVEGRPGKPRSHRYFRVTDIPEEMTSKAAGGMGGPWKKGFNHAETKERVIDFSGTGGQVAGPPSVWTETLKEGEDPRPLRTEVRAWETPGAEPAVVPMRELWDAVVRLALAAGAKDHTSQPPRRSPKAPPKPAEPADRAEAVERARAYIRNIDAVSGQGGHDATMRVACLLTNDHSLTKEEAWPLLVEWNAANAIPPWSEGELRHKLEGAAGQVGTKAQFPAGCKLKGDETDRKFNDPRRLAEEFPGTWRYWHDKMYSYDGTRYLAVPDHEVRAMLRIHIGARFERVYEWALRQYQEYDAKAGEAPSLFVQAEKGKMKLTAGGPPEEPKEPKRQRVDASLVREVLAELQATSLVNGMFKMPCMLPSGAEPHLLSFSNGLLDVNTLELRPHTADWFSAVSIPYDYVPGEVCVLLERALDTWFAGDRERIALAQEWAGYLLTRSTDAQKYMTLVGEGSNGKGAYSAALQALVGEDNVSVAPWQALGERFQLTQTLGKLLNVSDDIGEWDRAAEGTLKWFTGGQSMSFEQKGKDSFKAVPTARLMLACNTPPRVIDKSDGVWRRMLVLPFDVKITKKVPGMDKPKWWEKNANMSGVLNWALAGLARLRANGSEFTSPKRSEAYTRELQLEHNPARQFLTEHFVADEDCNDVKSADLYSRYRGWCAECGYEKPLGIATFAKEVKRAFEGARTMNRRVNRELAKYWRGIRRSDQEPALAA